MANGIIAQLKAAASDVQVEELDNLIHLRAQGKVLAASYSEFEMETPDWLTSALDTISRGIKSRRSDAIEAELKRTRAQLEALKTSEEKRRDLNAKLERLEKAKLAS